MLSVNKSTWAELRDSLANTWSRHLRLESRLILALHIFFAPLLCVQQVLLSKLRPMARLEQVEKWPSVCPKMIFCKLSCWFLNLFNSLLSLEFQGGMNRMLEMCQLALRLFFCPFNRWFVTFFMHWSQYWSSKLTFLLRKYQRFSSLISIVFSA